MTLVADMSQFRNFILSLFMSKQAREKMDAFHARQRNELLDSGRDLPTPVAPDPPVQSDQPMPDLLTEEEIAQAVDAAVARIDEAEKQAAKANLTQPQSSVQSDPSIGRAELIQMAVSIHKQKQSVLDDLDDEAREKLAAMAMQAFALDKTKK